MKTNFNKLFTGLAVASVLVLSLSSCSKDEDQAVTIGTLTVVNTVEGSAAQDVYLNNNIAGTVSYGNAISGVSPLTGESRIAFNNAGTGNTTATATILTGISSSQTVFFIKRIDGNYDIATYDNNNAAVSGKAKVRFINVAPLLSNTVNVATNTGTAIISALAFRTASAYQTVDAGTAFNVNMSGSLEITTISNTELQAGKVYTVWFDSSTSTKVKYHIILEN